jgi:hypothetical protein
MYPPSDTILHFKDRNLVTKRYKCPETEKMQDIPLEAYFFLLKVEQKYLESFEVVYWRRMKRIRWTDRVKNEELLHRIKEERNIIHKLKRKKFNWIDHILRGNCLAKRVIGGKMDGKVKATGRR